MPEPSGWAVPGYRDLEQIGSGPSSVVYRAHQEQSRQTVAVKVLSVNFTDTSTRLTFHRELQLTSGLGEHPNIVRVVDWGTNSGGQPYVAMDYHEAGSLHHLVATRGPLPLADVVNVGVKTAMALADAHRLGLLHSSVKPNNILLSHHGEPALADFGTAHLTATAELSGRARPLTLTHTAPEILEGHGPTPASDVYSLGATLYHLLAGRSPFGQDGSGIAGLLLRIHYDEPPRLARADVPPHALAVVRKAMAPQPAHRYSDAAALATALQSLQLDLGLSTTDLTTTTPPASPSRITGAHRADDIPGALRTDDTPHAPEPRYDGPPDANTPGDHLDRGNPATARPGLPPTPQEPATQLTPVLRSAADHTARPAPSDGYETVHIEALPRARRRRWPVAAVVICLLLVAAAVPALFAPSKKRSSTGPSGQAPVSQFPSDTALNPDVAPTSESASTSEPTTTQPISPAPIGSDTTTPATRTGPSGQPMPVGDLPGWRQVFTDDFTTDVDVGSFPGSAYGDTWRVYEDGTPDTSGRGVWYPSKVLSVEDGALNVQVHTENGVNVVAAALPLVADSDEGQLYARYTMRFRADPVPGYRTAWVLWPDSEEWPDDGHIEFPAGDLSEDIHAWMEYAQPSGGGEGFHTAATYPAWHTATTEWLPGKVTFILDGRVVGGITTRVPSTPLHLVIQTETCFDDCPPPSGSGSGNVQVDWLAIYTRA